MIKFIPWWWSSWLRQLCSLQRRKWISYQEKCQEWLWRYNGLRVCWVFCPSDTLNHYSSSLCFEVIPCGIFWLAAVYRLCYGIRVRKGHTGNCCGLYHTSWIFVSLELQSDYIFLLFLDLGRFIIVHPSQFSLVPATSANDAFLKLSSITIWRCHLFVTETSFQGVTIYITIGLMVIFNLPKYYCYNLPLKPLYPCEQG